MNLFLYKNVKNISPTTSGVTFHSDGFKTYLIYEPHNYQYRFQEPYLSSGSFTIERPDEGNFVYYIYGIHRENVNQQVKEENVLNFFEQLLIKDLSVSRSITLEVLKVVEENLSKYKKFSVD